MSEIHEGKPTVVEEQKPEEPIQEDEVCTIKETKDAPVNRTRRAVYVFLISILSLVSAVTLVGMGYESRVAEHFVLALIDLVEIVTIIYVGASVMDRGNFLGKIADAFSARGRNKRD